MIIIYFLSYFRMFPFYFQYPFYSQYVEPAMYSYQNITFQQKKDPNAIQYVVKQEQQHMEFKIKENPVNIQNEINLKPIQLQVEGYEITKRLWTEEQDKLLIHSVQDQQLNWKQISELLVGRNPKMCYNRYKRICKKKKILWTKQEDERLKLLVQQKKIKWKNLQKHFLNRKAKQLRQRYLNFLRSNISRQPWTLAQDLQLIQCINKIGKKWKKIEKVLTSRSQNQIKNRYYGRIQHIIKRKQQFNQVD